jgi:hypothetical protein
MGWKSLSERFGWPGGVGAFWGLLCRERVVLRGNQLLHPLPDPLVPEPRLGRNSKVSEADCYGLKPLGG